jgi:hypothetical protein
VHRYFLWGIQLATSLGTASSHLARLGQLIRTSDDHCSPLLLQVSVGDELPSLEVPLTRTLIVATAIASRDYQEVHHDPGMAQERGSKDIIMNILTTNGFVGRFVTDWAGPTPSSRR